MDHKVFENTSPNLPKYNATVVGAGPAGLAVIGKLLDSQLESILWIDPSFSAGRLSNYPEVPSNTKVKLFIKFIEASSSFQEAIKTFRKGSSRNSVFETLENMDQENGSSLYYAIELVKNLTDLVLEHYKDRITQKVSTVASIEGKLDSEWTLHTHDGNEFKTDFVFLATGSNPNVLEDCNDPVVNHVIGSFANDAKTISLDLSLYPSKLAETIKPEDSVAIIGSSHSAILALKNLVELPEGSRPKKIYNFYRSELRYAEYMDGWILYDNTGLKGDVAEWAKANLSEGKSIEGLTRLQLDELMRNEEQYREELKNVTASILSIGFKRNTLPQIVVNNEHIKQEQVSYDGQTANLIIKKEIRISSIFGYGIGFPEKVVDRYGNKECAVGLWKFMEYILKTLPTVLDNYLQK